MLRYLISLINWRAMTKEILIMAAIILAVNFVLPRSVVQGRSMEPNLHTGNRLAASPIPYWFSQPQRGDIVMLHPVEEGGPALVKRIVGVPDDTLVFLDQRLYINGELVEEDYITENCNDWKCPDANWHLGEGEIFVMGDNRNTSYDSRDYGPVGIDKIMGRVLVRWWPLTDLRLFGVE